MKKTIALLLLLTMLLTLVACKPSDDNPTPQQPPAESTNDGIFEPDEGLIVALVDYLKNKIVYSEIPSVSFAEQINEIKGGKRALHVKFNASMRYFVCAYSASNHQFEGFDNCCVDEYTWVGFNSEKTIPELYDGKRCVSLFQIDKSSYCKNIINPDASPVYMEHFQVIKTAQVEQKFEVIPSTDTISSFIYLDSSNEEIVYYTCKTPLHVNLSIPVVDLEGVTCIILNNFYEADGENEEHLKYHLGEYYAFIIDKTNVENYTRVLNDGRVVKSRIIDIDNLLEVVFG